MTTKPSDTKPSEQIKAAVLDNEWRADARTRELRSASNHETAAALAHLESVVSRAIEYLDEQHAAGQATQCPRSKYCNLPTGHRGMCRSAGPEHAAPVAAPPAQPAEQALIAYIRHHDGSRTPITPKQWAQAVLAHSLPPEESKAPPAQPDLLHCSGGCGKTSPRNPTIAVKYTCYGCVRKPDAPSAQPTSLVPDIDEPSEPALHLPADLFAAVAWSEDDIAAPPAQPVAAEPAVPVAGDLTPLELVNTIYELMDQGDTVEAVELVELFAKERNAAALTAANERTARLEAERAAANERARTAINIDRTGLAASLNHIQAIVRGYWWIAERTWGSYSYEKHTVETLQDEVKSIIEGVLSAAERALKQSGERADEMARGAPPSVAIGER